MEQIKSSLRGYARDTLGRMEMNIRVELNILTNHVAGCVIA